MKKRNVVMFILFIGAACGWALLGFTGAAVAGGGVNHKVKIENRTDFHCWVTVVYGGTVTNREYEERTIAPHSSTTVGTGAQCPRWIEGQCGEGIYAITVRDFQSRCTLGPDCDNCWNCTSTCWNSDWNITCKKTMQQIPLEDGDFKLNK
ncbi:MAG: hypothetical protein JW943_04230 [Deltaproteobacteria bacterium]|nr:hypothetical protein [Deltaproteobacteria bacterium]